MVCTLNLVVIYTLTLFIYYTIHISKMTSYKKIDLLDLSLSDECTIKNKKDLLEIKSPIIVYKIEDCNLLLYTNKYSDTHNLFLNLCSYIDRLFKMRDIPFNKIKNNNISINITPNSKFYDKNNKLLNIKDIQKEGKIICSFVCLNGFFELTNFLLIN